MRHRLKLKCINSAGGGGERGREIVIVCYKVKMNPRLATRLEQTNSTLGYTHHHNYRQISHRRPALETHRIEREGTGGGELSGFK